MDKKVAVILSGCGFLDGAEIRESVLTLLNLDEQGISYDIYAPNRDQHHALEHLQGNKEIPTRNILAESARIARGEIAPLSELNPDNYQGLVIPGGFGVAKNFCNFAFKGPAAEVQTDVANVLNSFFAANKPIGALCIAPALLALNFQGKNLKLTIGDDKSTSQAIEQLGHTHQTTQAHEFCADQENKIFTTAAYMFGTAKMHHINQGIKQVITALKEHL